MIETIMIPAGEYMAQADSTRSLIEPFVFIEKNCSL